MEDLFGPPIHIYTRQQAIEDGVLMPVDMANMTDGMSIGVCFTANLHGDYEDADSRRRLIRRGLALLNEPDPEDDEYRRLRVVEEDRVWVIWDGDGITFLRPEDY